MIICGKIYVVRYDQILKQLFFPSCCTNNFFIEPFSKEIADWMEDVSDHNFVFYTIFTLVTKTIKLPNTNNHTVLLITLRMYTYTLD